MKPQLHLKYFPLAIIILFIITGLMMTACSETQAKTYTVGVVNLSPSLDIVLEGFKESMAEYGYIEGENITYVYEGAASEKDKLDPIAQALVKAKVDLILSISTLGTQVAKQATANTDIPVVFAVVNDPVEAGIVTSLKSPGGNITGINFGTQEARRFEWLIQTAPAIKQVYIPYEPDNQSSTISIAAASKVAQKLGVELLTHEVHTPEEVTASIEAIPEAADAIFLLADTLVTARAKDFAKAAIEHKLPTSGPAIAFVEDNNIMTSYSFDMATSGKQAGRLADQILRGVKPADLPVETAEFISVINLKIVEAIGLDVPDTILRQADMIIR